MDEEIRKVQRYEVKCEVTGTSHEFNKVGASSPDEFSFSALALTFIGHRH